MIRPALVDDAGPVAEVIVAAGIFTADQAAFVPDLLAQFLSEAKDDTHGLVVDVDVNGRAVGHVVGVAYWHPVEGADGLVDLTMIAVHPRLQGTGRGRALLRYAEDRARAAGQRLMLVQTSGTDQYAGTRRFYTSLGYEQEATVRDYWAAGDDMVMFRFELSAPV